MHLSICIENKHLCFKLSEKSDLGPWPSFSYRLTLLLWSKSSSYSVFQRPDSEAPGCSRAYLHIPAPGHLREVFLLFKGLIYFIICHTEAPQPGFNGVMWFGKDYKFGHIWYTDNFSIHLRCKGNRFLNLSTIYQPEPTKREKTSYLKFNICHLKKKISFFNMINIATKCFLKKIGARKR